MVVIFVLLPLALLITLGFVGLFVWATRDGQFDDVETPQIRVLFDEDGSPGAPLEKPRADGSKGERG
jgi:cbb3-type cytochrome oxidase maturation protein